MNEIVVKLQEELKADQFILTGSTALKYHGLDVINNDIDIILINPTNETKEIN